MWLRRLVALVMIITCVGMNALVLVGFFSPTQKPVVNLSSSTTAAIPAPPTVSLTAKPDAITAGSFSAISWTTTGEVSTCTASDNWSGPKTANGAESTGRISTPGNYTYVLTCSNSGGSNKASAIIAVGAAIAPPSPVVPKNTTTVTASLYCGGSSPCYGAREVGQHAAAGNCWGWNIDRVYNISQLDSGFHKAKSGINTIEISQLCGKDLAPSLNGSVSAGGTTRNHNPTTKSNADQNETPYVVGYFDANKP
ncbi:MAG: hypothetical protein ABI602_04690 [Candidatus Saccharibacteria bacterium]